MNENIMNNFFNHKLWSMISIYHNYSQLFIIIYYLLFIYLLFIYYLFIIITLLILHNKKSKQFNYKYCIIDFLL